MEYHHKPPIYISDAPCRPRNAVSMVVQRILNDPSAMSLSLSTISVDLPGISLCRKTSVKQTFNERLGRSKISIDRLKG